MQKPMHTPKPKKDNGLKLAILIASGCILVGILAIVFMVQSRSVTNEYRQRINLALQVALTSDGLHVEAEDGWHELDEESYRKLNFYLTQNVNLTFSKGDAGGEAIALRIGTDPVTIVHNGDSEEKAVVTFTTADKSFRIRIEGSKLWQGLRAAVGTERYYLPEAED